jgi:hypothetical protein
MPDLQQRLQRPTLYNWGQPNGDPRYCGLDLDTLMQTGQGLFTFTEVVPPDHHVIGHGLPRN